MDDHDRSQLDSAKPTVLISTYLEPELVGRIRSAADIDVAYAPEILPVPRYSNDHHGASRRLTPEQTQQWTAMLAEADIAFDFDWRAPADLLTTAPRLRWVQATSAGIGGFVQRHRLDRGSVVFTTAAGTHATPLAEFAVAGALYFVKDVPGLLAGQRAHHWERKVTGVLAGCHAAVLGLGATGRRVAQLYRSLGVRVTGVGRPGGQYDLPDGCGLISTDDLDQILPQVDILVLACPLTEATRNIIHADRVAALRPGAIVVNIARGQVIDEPALTAALISGGLGGAALDVFDTEPLPGGSTLWDLPNVLVSPHSASTAANENAVLTELFIDNLHLYLTGKPLRNLYRSDRGY